MDIEKCLAAVDAWRARGFPENETGPDPAGTGRGPAGTDRGPGGTGRGSGQGGREPAETGPGFHITALATSHGLRTADAAERGATLARFHDDCDALAGKLTDRWGTPYRVGLQTVRLRTAHEEIPEPWARLSLLVADVHLWQPLTEGCWIALGVADLDSDDEVSLLLVVTETDPV